MNPSESQIWEPIEVPPHGPSVAPALLYHRHNSGTACIACHIVALRAKLETQEKEIATDDSLLAERNRILDMLPCPNHGPCVPYVLDEIIRMREKIEEQSRVIARLSTLPDVIEKIAFEIPPVNLFTPRLVQLAIEVRQALSPRRRRENAVP